MPSCPATVVCAGLRLLVARVETGVQDMQMDQFVRVTEAGIVQRIHRKVEPGLGLVLIGEIIKATETLITRKGKSHNNILQGV